MESKEPLVSIIMPAYNAADYIGEAIKSLLKQSFSNFELLIIDDKSTDNTISIVEKFDDPRIRLYKNEKNLGQSRSKNSTIHQASGKYIAFLDADDISHPDKLQIQVDFLEMNLDICGVGTFALVIDDKEKDIGKIILPTNFDDIKVQTLFYPCYVHPSIMVRRKEFYELNELYYNHDYLYAQDYELYTRIVHKVKMINIPDFLYTVRKWSQQISKKHNVEQINYFIQGLKKQLLNELKIDVDERQTETIRITCRNREKKSLNESGIVTYYELLNQIWLSNLEHNIYNNQSLKDYLMQRYLDAFSVFSGDYSRYLSCYLKFEKTLFHRVNVKNRLKMAKRYFLSIKSKS